MGERSATDYYARRQRQERELAEAAPSPAIRKIHTTLAQNYARLAGVGESPKARERLHIVSN
jgi:hypothetical protein